MKTRMNTPAGLAIVALLAVAADGRAQATNRTGRGFGPQGPRVISPEISPERKLTFRILAPKAETVRLAGGDIQGLGENTAMVKGTNGVWEITVGPINSGAYRYNFNV